MTPNPSLWSVLLLVLPTAALAQSIDVGFPSEGRASRPFEALAGSAPVLQTDTDGRALHALAVPEVLYIIDGHCISSPASFWQRPVLGPRNMPYADGTWTRVWGPFYRPALLLDGVPQAAWRAPSVHELMP